MTKKWTVALAAAWLALGGAARAEDFPTGAPASEDGSAPAAPRENVRVKRYPSGELMSEYEVWEGKLDGLCTDYYKNGQKMYQWSYLRDKLHGASRAWSIDGRLVSEWRYRKGVLHGKTLHFHPNRKKRSVEKYVKGKLMDKRTYSEKGKLLKRERAPAGGR
jgi:antitoxin component YwqK of YwqJK toxin-antitoxin module